MPWCGTEDRRSCYSTSQHTRTSAQTHMHMHTHRHKCTQHTHAHTYTYMHTRTHEHMHTNTHTHTHCRCSEKPAGQGSSHGSMDEKPGVGATGSSAPGHGCTLQGVCRLPPGEQVLPLEDVLGRADCGASPAFTESGLTSAGASGGRRRGAQVNLHLSSVLLPLPHAAHRRQGPPGL